MKGSLSFWLVGFSLLIQFYHLSFSIKFLNSLGLLDFFLKKKWHKSNKTEKTPKSKKKYSTILITLIQGGGASGKKKSGGGGGGGPFQQRMLSTKRPFTPRCAERSVGSRPLSSGLSGHRHSALMIVEESDDDLAASLKLAPLHQVGH